MSEQHPEAMISLGVPWMTDGTQVPRSEITDHLATMLTTTVADLDARVAGESFDEFASLIAGTGSINNRLDRVRHALGLLPGYQARNG